MHKDKQQIEILERVSVQIEDLTPDPSNARSHNPANLDAIKASLLRFGQVKPIVVQRKAGVGMIVRAGNGTVEAAQELGWDALEANVIECSDQTAIAYALADNKTAALADWDIEVLSMNLDSLQESPELLSATGFSQSELDVLLAADWQASASDEPLPVLEGGDDGDGDGGGNEAPTAPWMADPVIREAMNQYRAMHDLDDGVSGVEVLAAICKEWSDSVTP